MELTLVAIMVIAGAVIALIVLAGVAVHVGDEAGASGNRSRSPDRQQIAGSILYLVVRRGGVPEKEALKSVQRFLGASPPVADIDLSSWAEVYAQRSSAAERERLLENAVEVATAHSREFPLEQYNALLELSFALGFQTDALARLRERYQFGYVDHAKYSRPRDADRSGGAAPLFVRESERENLLRILGLEEGASREDVITRYRRLATQRHPDRYYGASEEEQLAAAEDFRRITRAYENLLALFEKELH